MGITYPQKTVQVQMDLQAGAFRSLQDTAGLIVRRSYAGKGIIAGENVNQISAGQFATYFSTGKVFNSLGRPTKLSVTSPMETRDVLYAFNPEGQVVSAGAQTLSYDGIGLISNVTLDNSSTQFTHSSFGEISGYETSVAGTALHKVELVRDKLSRVIERKETLGSEVTSYKFTYLPNGRLRTSRKNREPAIGYGYNANGDRVRTTQSGVSTLATYDRQDRLVQWGGYLYLYNKNGEMIERAHTVLASSRQFSYSFDGNLESVVLEDGKQISYKLDPLGRRLEKQVNGVVLERYIYDDQRIIGVLSPAGNILQQYIYASSGHSPDYMVSGGVRYKFLKDQIGSIRAVVNSSTGVSAQVIEYGPWGQVISDTNPGFQNLGFAGGLYDRDTGLVRFGVREFCPTRPES